MATQPGIEKLLHSHGSPRVVIVGGGLSGVMLATRLGRYYKRRSGAEICLIDKAPIHVWKPMLHTFAAGTANAHDDGLPLVAQAERAGFTYLPGAFTTIDTRQSTLSISFDGLPDKDPITHTTPYSVAVFAIGSIANDFGVDGVGEHCHFIDTLWSAEALNLAVRTELVERIIKGGDISVAIVGGGATGVEFAAAMARLVNVGASFGVSDLPARLKVTLLDAGDRILNAFPEEISERVSATLSELGVTIVPNASVVRADSSGYHLANGERVNAAIRVWAAGVKAPRELNALNEFQKARSGQLVVDERLQTSAAPNIFAMGDCASYTPTGAARPLPPTGQVARQQADYLATAIPRLLIRAPQKPFAYRELGSLVSLSQFGAYGTLGGTGVVPPVAIRGWFAKRAHDVFYRMHQFGLYGPVRGSLVMLRDGLNALIKPGIRLD